MRLHYLIALAALSGCAHQPVYVYPELPLPPPPVLPTVLASEFIDLSGEETADELREKLPDTPTTCISISAYEALAVRDALRKGYAEQLRAIIQAHNERD